MAFLETQFPVTIANGSQGGPGYSTRIISAYSGYEDRNANWANARYTYDAGSGIRTLAQMEELIAFFHLVQGSFSGFRWKDHMDYKSSAVTGTIARTDQTLGTGDGADLTYQLIKTYTYGATGSRARTITKPVSGTVLIDVDGSLQTSGGGNDYTLDYTTGLVTFTTGSVPVTGEVVKAGYEFDVPCRFGIDQLQVTYETCTYGSAQIPIVEIRP